VWGKACEVLASAGHDVVWAGDWNEDPGDDEILVVARRDRRVLVTLDKDFAELAIVRRIPHSGIIRIVNMSASRQAGACLLALNRYGKELERGAGPS